MMSLASGRALSSIATRRVREERIVVGRRRRRVDRRRSWLNSTMARGFVKNWASAIDAFGNFVSALTEMPIRPLPVTPDLPSGAGATARSPYSVGVVRLDVADQVGAGLVERAPGRPRRAAAPTRSSAVVRAVLSTVPALTMSTYIWSHATRLGRVEGEALAVIADRP